MSRTPSLLRPLALLLALFFLTGSPSSSANRSSVADLEAAWARVLEAHLRAGSKHGVDLARFDYAAVARGDADYRATLEQLALLDPATLSEVEAKALWINAYNILAVKMVVDHWPLESIRDAGGRLFGRVWTRPAGQIGGQTYTLDQIEHEILRPLGDPRIHAAIVCASVSCPDLARKPFTASHLDDQLDQAMMDFLANPTKGLRVEGSTVWTSSIFDWFGEDFEASGGVLVNLRRFGPADLRWPPEPRVRYLEYDWSLND